MQITASISMQMEIWLLIEKNTRLTAEVWKLKLSVMKIFSSISWNWISLWQELTKILKKNGTITVFASKQENSVSKRMIPSDAVCTISDTVRKSFMNRIWTATDFSHSTPHTNMKRMVSMTYSPTNPQTWLYVMLSMPTRLEISIFPCSTAVSKQALILTAAVPF